ncbi:MAG TPA: orotate phosphoribosyltransferase [Vicinamibacteria bacterium]|nr:orotate phosphoribosyltransferase [Vicinamibacteria bacterium]
MGTKPYQDRFIELLAENDVIRFGEFTLKSGRKSPYFINAGQLRTGRAIAGVGRAYAERIREAGLSPDVVFGPSYKGVPLAVATAIALSEWGRDVGFSFDRKEAKEHGEGGVFVGTQPSAGQGVVLVDDVITSGTSIEQAVLLLRNAADVTILGVVVAVDRQERGRERSTLSELESTLGAPVLPVLNVRQIVERLKPEQKARVEEYLGLYGAS